MEYVADELGVPLKLPVLQRELSLAGRPGGHRALRRLIRRTAAGRPPHAHGEGGRDRAAGGAPAGSARPRAIVHTYHGHVLSGYFTVAGNASSARSNGARAHDRRRSSPSATRCGTISSASASRPRDASQSSLTASTCRPGATRTSERERRSARELGAADDDFVVGWAGRLTAIKKPLDLVRTLRPSSTTRSTRCSCSSATARTGADVEALAAELGVAERCRFVGFQKSIRRWYAAFDALLLTSANEGTPVVAIEALAAGRPVVATRAGGTGTVVRNGETGYLAAIGDTPALARAPRDARRRPRAA